MLLCAPEILKSLSMETSPRLITPLHKQFAVAVLAAEVSNSLGHHFDSNLCLASSAFPVLST